MKCPKCDTYIVKIPVNWKCPHCNERLPDPSAWFNFYEALVEYLNEKGAVFWGVALGFLVLFIGGIDMVFGQSALISYIGRNFLFSALMLFYGGMIIDMYMKVILPLRMMSGSEFIFRERAVIRNYRKGSHLALAVALVICLFVIGPRAFLYYFPSWFIVIGSVMALAWAIGGLFFDPRMIEDVRFRAFLDRIGITSLKKLRRVSTFVIATLLVTLIGFWILNQVPRLPQKISNSSLLGGVIHFFKTYFDWLI